MEESEQRKERLKAMRMEAAMGGVGDGVGNSSIVSQSLANPLMDANSPSSIRPESVAAPRFDYYTDPLAAFSSNRRSSSKVSHQIPPDYSTPPRGPGNPSSILPATHQSNYSPHLRPFQAQGPQYYGPGPFRGPGPGPMGAPNPYNTPRGNINHWGVPGGSSPNFPPNLQNTSPGFGQGSRPGFNYGQGRGYSFNNRPPSGSGRGNPYHNSGRGRSSGMGSSGSSGMHSGSRNAVAAELRPDMYYKRSMVEDPWKRLIPVLWKQINLSSSSTYLDGASSNSWLPKSISSKKPRVSATPEKNKSGQSLAEYLAASFNEAANETVDNDVGQDITPETSSGR